MRRPPPRSTLFPYTTLFRSEVMRRYTKAELAARLEAMGLPFAPIAKPWEDRKSTRLNSSHVSISYAVFCLKKKKTKAHMKLTTTETSTAEETLATNHRKPPL